MKNVLDASRNPCRGGAVSDLCIQPEQPPGYNRIRYVGPGAPTCTVVHLSDLHSKPSARILNETAAQKPDIICITGDYINDKNRNRQKMLDYGRQLVQLAPVLYIPGNHERRLADFDTLMHELSAIGFHVLTDKIETVKGITFLGLDENQASFEAYRQRKAGTFHYRDSSALFARLAEHPGYKIVLCHYPENFAAVAENNYRQYDFDLQLSGHAHGGQWILPGIGPVFSPVRVCAHSTPGAALESGRD